MNLESINKFMVIGKSINGIKGQNIYFSIKNNRYYWTTNSELAYHFDSLEIAEKRLKKISTKKLLEKVSSIVIKKYEFNINKSLY